MDDLNLNQINHLIIWRSSKSLIFWVKVSSLVKIFIVSLTITIVIIESQIMIIAYAITRIFIIIDSDSMDHLGVSEITIIQMSHFWEPIISAIFKKLFMIMI